MINKKYKNAMIIGKFMPFHKGHRVMIEFAKSLATVVHIFPLGHDKESIPLKTRVKWISDEFKYEPITVTRVNYDPSELDESSESNEKSSREWASYLKTHIEECNIDVIVGSEMYVKYMADYLGIDYELYDVERTNVHISATDIRNNPIKYWDYLCPSTKRTYAKHICVCGSESTGKTTVCTEIEKSMHGVTMVPELGRVLIGNANTMYVELLENNMVLHKMILEQVMMDPPTPIMLWDTDNFTSLSYYTKFFNDAVKDSSLIMIKRPDIIIPIADKHFFFESNEHYDSDYTRVSQEAAKELSKHHIETYEKYGINLEMVNGDLVDKENTVKAYISKCLDELTEKFKQSI